MMENWLLAPYMDVVYTAITVVVLYAGMIFITKIGGLRTFADFTTVDFVSTIAIGSMLGIIILNGKISLIKGFVAITVLLIMQAVLTYFKRNSPAFKKRAINTPVLLYYEDQICRDNLKKFHLSESDLMGKIRAANVKHLSDVDAVVFELNGEISVIHSHKPGKIDPEIMKDVMR